MRSPRVILITDEAFADPHLVAGVLAAGRALNEAGFPAGTLAVQLREKRRAGREAWAARLRQVTRSASASFVVNGDVALARLVDADGVHFGSGATLEAVETARGLWRSMAAHSDDDVKDAQARGVDAVLVSPIFATPGKGLPRGLGAVRSAVARSGGRVAVFALGGVDPANAPACYDAGAAGVAVIRALFEAIDPGAVALGLAGPRSTVG